ncbi:MAG: choice-of-anchor X domain-containing protein [Oleiphilaceae bacterium]|nr:choice-of-anchor X domain-containing protein [Oleiphilaceae bacterium]
MNNKILKTLTALISTGLMAPAFAADPQTADLAERAARDYREQARYPAWSQAVALGAPDPVQAERTPSRQTLPGPNGASPALSVWSSDLRAESGDTITLYAEMVEKKPKDTLAIMLSSGADENDAWTLTGELVGHNSGTLAEIDYRDDGKSPDEVAGDGVYTGSYTLPGEHRPEMGKAENIAVRVTAENPQAEPRHAVGGFLYSHPAAALTGRFRDSEVDGNLVLQAEVAVFKAARFHLQGTLAAPSGQSIATAKTSETLEPDTHWIDLPFYGLAFHERGLPGVYQLNTVTLSTTGSIPNALGPLMHNAHNTRAYGLSQFSSQPFGRKNLLEAAQRLEKQSQR